MNSPAFEPSSPSSEHLEHECAALIHAQALEMFAHFEGFYESFLKHNGQSLTAHQCDNILLEYTLSFLDDLFELYNPSPSDFPIWDSYWIQAVELPFAPDGIEYWLEAFFAHQEQGALSPKARATLLKAFADFFQAIAVRVHRDFLKTSLDYVDARELQKDPQWSKVLALGVGSGTGGGLVILAFILSQKSIRQLFFDWLNRVFLE